MITFKGNADWENCSVTWCCAIKCAWPPKITYFMSLSLWIAYRQWVPHEHFFLFRVVASRDRMSNQPVVCGLGIGHFSRLWQQVVSARSPASWNKWLIMRLYWDIYCLWRNGGKVKTCLFKPIVLWKMIFQHFNGLMNMKVKRECGSFLKLEPKQLSVAYHLGNFTILSMLGVHEELEQIGN